MKHIILNLLILTFSISGISAMRPKTNYQTSYLEITDIERQDTSLRLSVILKHLPGYWVNIPKEGLYLRSQNDTARKYKLTGAENIELGKRTWMKESGKHEGTLIFEKIPSDISMLDLLETDANSKTEIMAAGINVEEEASTDMPSMIDPKTLFDTASAEAWKGLDPSRYKDIPYYQEEGKAYIKGKLDGYHPAAGYSTLKIHTNNFITGSRDTQTEALNPDGTFEFDVNVEYPQYCSLEIGDAPSKDVFVIPGDTVEITTTTLTDFVNPRTGYRKYFGFTGRLNDATAVNLLTDTLRIRYDFDKIISQYLAAIKDTSADTIKSKEEEMRLVLNSILSDLPEFLGTVPVSTYVKDLLATEVLTGFSAVTRGKIGENGRLISCNPLAISTEKYFYHTIGKDELLRGLTPNKEENCFALQLLSAKALIESIETVILHDRESLNRTKERLGNMSSMIKYPALTKAMLNAYTNLAMDVALAENSLKPAPEYITLDVGSEKDVLEELIKPYLGNLIYIDFWALWCPPCRQGMIDQKKTIECFAGEPFKVLYVSDDSNIAGSNQWLEKKGITGEHIFLSNENWKRISEYFNFNYIPFGVLIGKDGNLIKTHFNLDSPNAEKEIERHLLQ